MLGGAEAVPTADGALLPLRLAALPVRGADDVNAIAMIVRCARGQQSGPDYTVSTSRGIEASESVPTFAAPSDTGVAGHGEFHMPGIAMAEMY